MTDLMSGRAVAATVETVTGTIDLGVLPPGEVERVEQAGQIEAEPWWLGWFGWRRPGCRPRGWRPWARWTAMATLAGVLPLVVLGGAAAPARPFATLERTLPLGFDASVTYDEHRLYAVANTEPVGGRSALTAYRLDDGTVMWEVELGYGERPGALVGVVDSALIFFGVGPAGPGTTAFNPEDGHQLWHHPDRPTTAIEGHLLLESVGLVVTVEPGSTETVERDHLHYVTLIDIGTGRVGWQRTLSARRVATGGAADPYLATMAADGRLATYDLLTGGQVATGHHPTRQARLHVSNSLVLVSDHARGGAIQITAYAAEDLSRAWTTTLPNGSVVAACGPVICGHSPTTHSVVDPRTGEVLWSPQGQPPGQGMWYQTYPPAHEALQDLLVLSFPRQNLGPHLVVADTGEVVLDLGQWRLAHPRPSGFETTGIGPDAPLVTREADGGIWLGEISADRSSVEPVGRFDGALRHCTVMATYTVCLGDMGREAQIWRIHR
jgi:hypothetical protein